MKYLCHFLHRHLDFRRSELESLAALAGVGPLWWDAPLGGQPLSPFWRVHLPNDDAARRVAERALLLKARRRSSLQGGWPARLPSYLGAVCRSWRALVKRQATSAGRFAHR